MVPLIWTRNYCRNSCYKKIKCLSRGTVSSHPTSLSGFVLGKVILYAEISNKFCDLSLLHCAHSLSLKAGEVAVQ
jgi:hypothetical protein